MDAADKCNVRLSTVLSQARTAPCGRAFLSSEMTFVSSKYIELQRLRSTPAQLAPGWHVELTAGKVGHQPFFDIHGALLA